MQTGGDQPLRRDIPSPAVVSCPAWSMLLGLGDCEQVLQESVGMIS